MTHSALQAHIESVLSRCRERDERLTRQEVEDLCTDSCAAVLSMEADRVHVKRQLVAAEAKRQRAFPAFVMGQPR